MSTETTKYFRKESAPKQIIRFDSVADAMAADIHGSDKWAPYAAEIFKSPWKTCGHRFLRPTLEESAADIRAGWPAGVAAMERKMTELRNAPAALRMETQWDVSGDEVDIGRFLDGEPECMGTAHLIEVPAAGRVIELSVILTPDGTTGPEKIAACSVGVLAIIDAIEAAGMRCEVNLCNTLSVGVSYDSKIAYNRVVITRLKRAEDPLDLGAIAGGLHPDFTRRWGGAGLHGHTGHVGCEGEMSFIHPASLYNIPGTLIDLSLAEWTSTGPDWINERINKIMKELGIASAA